MPSETKAVRKAAVQHKAQVSRGSRAGSAPVPARQMIPGWVPCPAGQTLHPQAGGTARTEPRAGASSRLREIRTSITSPGLTSL